MLDLPVLLILTMLLLLLLKANAYLQIRILKRKNLNWLWIIVAWLLFSILLSFALKHFSVSFDISTIDIQDIQAYLHFFLLLNVPLEITIIIHLIYTGIRLNKKKNHLSSLRNETEISESENG